MCSTVLSASSQPSSAIIILYPPHFLTSFFSVLIFFNSGFSDAKTHHAELETFFKGKKQKRRKAQ
jgi:hypothetical protein